MSDNVFNDQVDLFCNELWKEMQQKFPLERPLKDKEKRNQLMELGKEIEKKAGTREAIYLSQKYNELSSQLGTNDNPLTSDNVYIHGANENLIHLVDTIKETNNNNSPTDIYEWTANICDKMENSEASQEFKRFVTEFAGKENVEKMFPRPEPVVEIDPKKKEKIEKWMKAVGLEDKADEMIQAYGDKTYAVVQNAMANPADMTKLTDGTYRNSKNTLLYLLENKEVMKDKVSELQIVKKTKQPDKSLNHRSSDPATMKLDDFWNGFLEDPANKPYPILLHAAYSKAYAEGVTNPKDFLEGPYLDQIKERMKDDPTADEQYNNAKKMISDYYVKEFGTLETVEPLVVNTEMAKLNLNVSELEIPETIAIQPISLNYGLSKEDADKVKFASAMKSVLNKGIEGYYTGEAVQDACDKVFKACINDEKMNSDIGEWSLAFTNKLVEELNISNKVDGDNDKFQKLTRPLFDVRYNIVSNLKNGTDLGIIDSNYVEQARTAQKEAIKRDMKNQEGEIVENADTIEKGEKVEKRLTFRERCKKGWDRVVGWFKGTKEEMVAYDEPENEQQGNTGAPVYSTTKHGNER